MVGIYWEYTYLGPYLPNMFLLYSWGSPFGVRITVPEMIETIRLPHPKTSKQLESAQKLLVGIVLGP